MESVRTSGCLSSKPGFSLYLINPLAYCQIAVMINRTVIAQPSHRSRPHLKAVAPILVRQPVDLLAKLSRAYELRWGR